MGFIVAVALLLCFVYIYYMLGGTSLGVNPKDDDPSQEHWPFHNERLTK